MSLVAGYLTVTEIANRTGVRLSAVSNWLARYSDFPAPHLVSGQEAFEVDEVARWLRERRIPRNRLKPDEPPGTSYGDRLLSDVGGSGSSTAIASTDDVRSTESAWTAQLRKVTSRLRGTHDAPSSLEFLLGLVYVRTCRADVWPSLVGASDWLEMHDLLTRVSLPTRTDTAVPVFGKVSRTADPSFVEAVRLVNEIDLGADDGPRSIAAQISDTILADLERGMGRSGGRFTPPDVARCLVELLDPQPSDRVYDPFCGSGELLSAAAAHVGRQGGSLDSWQVYGQTPNEWSWLTSTMNLALHGIKADLGGPGQAMLADLFPARRFSRILTNPPFNLRDVEPQRDRSWPFGEPPQRNANFAWLQNAVAKLEPRGRAAVVMPGAPAFVRDGRELAIRTAMIEAGVIECVIGLPGQLFRFTGIPTMIWILRGVGAEPDPQEVLFIDARHLGEMVDHTKRRLGTDNIRRIVDEYRKWRSSRNSRIFNGTAGFSRAVGHHELSENSYVLEPGRYTGLAAEEPDTARIVTELGALRTEFDSLSRRAEQLRAAIDGRLADLVVDDRPGGAGRFVPLGTVCEVLPGPGTVSRSGRQPSWTPLVLPRNIRNDRIGQDDLDVVPPRTAERMVRYRLVAGDIVSARTGTLGRYGQVLDAQSGWLVGPGCVRFRPNEQADSDYLTYYLGGPAARRWLKEHATGTAIQQINTATLREMPIWLPPLHEQRSILEILNPLHTAASIHDRISSTAQDLHNLLVPVLMSPPVGPDSALDGDSVPPGTRAMT